MTLKLLVTGGLGFIGSNFVRYMFTKHDDIQIINLDKLYIDSNPANLKDAEGDDRYKLVEDRPGHDLRYSLDSTKIRRELGWKPKHTFQSSLEETVTWYAENESWRKPLTTDKVLHPTPWKFR